MNGGRKSKENNNTEFKIGVIGGDRRLCAFTEAAAGDGFECAVWGSAECRYGVKCRTVESAIQDSVAVILPLPVSQDGVRLFAPASPEGTELRLARLIEMIPSGMMVFGGKFPCEFACALRERGITVIDYYENEAFKIKNAYQTAEGAVGAAITELPITVFGSRMLVIGYGRVGRTTARLLGKLGARVTVAARSESDLAHAYCEGCNTVDISRSLAGIDGGYDAVFNTVPARILTRNVLKKFEGRLLIDLASSPFGEDAEEAEEAGVKLIRAVSLPGKTAPISAGISIYQTVRDIMRKEGIIK